MPENQAAVDGLAPTDDDSVGEQTSSSSASTLFRRMHPLGWVALGFGVAAVIMTLAGSRFLVGNMAWWHWALVAITIVLSTQAPVLNAIRVAIEALSSFGKSVAWILAWVVFVVQLFNVITRYSNNWFEADILFGEATSLAWQSFGLLFLLGVGYAVKDGVNPRIDFWWADFSSRRKAWIDFIFHTFLLAPFVVMALRLVIPFAKTSLGQRRDGTWPSGIRVWETWEQSGDAAQLPVGPIQAALVIGFTLWGLQVLAEMIKTGFVLAGRDDLGAIKETDAPLRVE